MKSVVKETESLTFKDLVDGDFIWGYSVEDFRVVRIEVISVRATTQTKDGRPRVRIRFIDSQGRNGQAYIEPKRMSDSSWEKGVDENYECPWKLFTSKKEALKDSLVVGRYKIVYLEMELEKMKKVLEENRRLELLEYAEF